MALPGVTTVLKDRFFTMTRTDAPVGPRVLAIATRDTLDTEVDTSGSIVPSYDPYAPRGEADCIAAFGEGSGCHRAYLEMVAGGAVRPTLVAIPAASADTPMTDANLHSDATLSLAFDAAETARPDIIVPWGRGGHPADWQNPATPADDVPFGFYADAAGLLQKIADRVRDISNRSHPCFAVMGVKPYVGTGTSATENMPAANISTHLALASLPNNETVTDGQYVSVVACELNLTGYPQHPTIPGLAGAFGYSNGAAVYAGHASQLDSWQAMTGKSIFNVTGVRYNPTRPQQEAVSVMGAMPVALNFNRVPVWVDGATFGTPNSDYIRLSTLRITFDAVLGIRQIAQSYIGEPATLANRNAFETSLTGFLKGMQQLGALYDSAFSVSYISRQNKAIVDLVLRPVFELRNIEISIAVDLA